MAEKWRRCDKCRKVRPIEDFTGAEPRCQSCLAPTAGTGRPRARSSAVTTRSVAAPVGTVDVIAGPRMRDLRGRGDPEVRARRARARALDRLAERYSEDFELLLREERRSEGL